MLPLLVRRRRDGLVQIRRARARDVVLSSDAAVLLLLLLGFVCLALLLVFTLLFSPPLLFALGLWGIALWAAEGYRARQLRLVEQRLPPGPRGAA